MEPFNPTNFLLLLMECSRVFIGAALLSEFFQHLFFYAVHVGGERGFSAIFVESVSLLVSLVNFCGICKTLALKCFFFFKFPVFWRIFYVVD